MNMMKPIYMISYIHISMSYVSMMNDKYLSNGNLSSECPRSPDHMERFACPKPDRRGRFRCIDDRYIDTSSHGYITSGQRNTSSYFPDDLTNHDISLFFRALCDGFYDCPDKEDENPDHCLFYKTVGFHNSQTIFLFKICISCLTVFSNQILASCRIVFICTLPPQLIHIQMRRRIEFLNKIDFEKYS